MTDRTEFTRDLAGVLNKHSVENASNTPDFILADYIVKCLDNFAFSVKAREEWYGRTEKIGYDIESS